MAECGGLDRVWPHHTNDGWQTGPQELEARGIVVLKTTNKARFLCRCRRVLCPWWAVQESQNSKKVLKVLQVLKVLRLSKWAAIHSDRINIARDTLGYTVANGLVLVQSW